jgi:hypothetical protein
MMLMYAINAEIPFQEQFGIFEKIPLTPYHFSWYGIPIKDESGKRKETPMKKIAKCPNNSNHDRFTTTTHEMHNWIVDENGEFVKDLGCLSISHGPDTDNVWICSKCRAQAVFVEVED